MDEHFAKLVQSDKVSLVTSLIVYMAAAYADYFVAFLEGKEHTQRLMFGG